VRLVPPRTDDDWVGLSAEPIPVGRAVAWAERPHCGAVVLFTGTVRDHAEGRPGVSALEYEAYEEEVLPRLSAIVAEARRRWADLGRVAVVHRVGSLSVGETSVLIVVSAPHRAEAFEAARFCIDTVKTTVPIWKRETWEGGSDWALCSHPVDQVSEIDEVAEVNEVTTS
jgi:molybdopterin synthase catalytic subunit